MQKIIRKTAVCLMFLITGLSFGQAIIIDHNCVDITQIPESALNAARSNLHIAYGHTSHGSQLTTGMNGLVAFANGGGKGLSLPADIFAWNNGGTSGALDLHDYAMGGDCGYYPQWRDNTINYLASHGDVNVIIWSWCGQVDSKYREGKLHSEYLTPMAALETTYPAVKFVYMTGHVDHWDDADNKAANQVIRDYCNTNGKILYDFADIESYDPNGTFYAFPHDNCDYYVSSSGSRIGNWATTWRSSHTENVDWYSCSSAHSDALNANQKAYAAWWLWAKLAGWDGSLAVQMSRFTVENTSEGVQVIWKVESETNCIGFHIWRNDNPAGAFKRITTQLINGRGNNFSGAEYSYIDEDVEPGESYYYKVEEVSSDNKKQFHGPVLARYERVVPRTIELGQNYPNPFNPETKISYALPEQGEIELTVFNLGGQVVIVLEAGLRAAGSHEVVWNGRDKAGNAVQAGIYFYRLKTEKNVQTKKMTYLK